MRRASVALTAVFLLALTAAASASAAEVKTEAATNILAKKATLNAKIFPNEKDILYGFEYGTTTAYGSGTLGQKTGPGFFVRSVSSIVEGLKPNTTYHFRVVAVGGGTGIVYGADKTFKTAPGLYLTGQASESEAEQPKLAATSYPRSFGGPQSGALKLFEASGFPAMCEGVSVLGPTINEATSEFPLFPVHEGGTLSGNCEFFEEKVSVKLNGCYFTYKIANSGPPYTGSSGIECAKAGNMIEIPNVSCTVKIPAQTFGGTVNYEEEIGGGPGVRVSTSATGITYQKSGPLCFLLSGGTSNGKSAMAFDLS